MMHASTVKTAAFDLRKNAVRIRNRAGIAALSSIVAAFTAEAASQFMDYFMPTPIVGSLSSTCWGAAQVGARDQSNGLEDRTLAKYVYWDGGILKEGNTYYMFASRWDQSLGHNGWMSGSKVVWATSDNLYGPYTDRGYCFTDNGSAGHNVNVIRLRNGDPCGKRYGMTLSGSVAGSGRVYVADSLKGPWSYLGDIKMDLNGYSGRFLSGDNFRVIVRPDGKYMCLTGRIGISDSSILGPYKCQQAKDFTASVAGSPTVNMEDPNIFYSGGKYHVLYNQWSTATAYSYTSTDGINFTLDKGVAYQPAANMVRYTNGTVNHWKLLERPFAYLENGHVVAFTFAAINSEKAEDKANDQNGSKVIVVPFDGAAFDGVTGIQTGKSPGDVKQKVSLRIAQSGIMTKATLAVPVRMLHDADRFNLDVCTIHGSLVVRADNVSLDGGCLTLSIKQRLARGMYLVTVRNGSQKVSVPMTIQ